MSFAGFIPFRYWKRIEIFPLLLHDGFFLRFFAYILLGISVLHPSRAKGIGRFEKSSLAFSRLYFNISLWFHPVLCREIQNTYYLKIIGFEIL